MRVIFVLASSFLAAWGKVFGPFLPNPGDNPLSMYGRACDPSEPRPEKRDGSDYRGCMNVTRSGRPCKQWPASKLHPDQENGNGNFCRNPDGKEYLYCYAEDDESDWEYCKVQISCHGKLSEVADQCKWPRCGADGVLHESRVDGSPCDDGNKNTAGDKCMEGKCIGIDPCDSMKCSDRAVPECHKTAVCDSENGGVCIVPAMEDDEPCTFKATMKPGFCKSGMCTYSQLCGDEYCYSEQCKVPFCSDNTCKMLQLPDGTGCFDNNPYTQGDRCIKGVCKGKCGGRDQGCSTQLELYDGNCMTDADCEPHLKCGPVGSCKHYRNGSRFWPDSSEKGFDKLDACCIPRDHSCEGSSCKGMCQNLISTDTCKCSCRVGCEDVGDCCPDMKEACTNLLDSCSCSGKCGTTPEECSCSCEPTCGSFGNPRCCEDYDEECNLQCSCTGLCGSEHDTCQCTCASFCQHCHEEPEAVQLDMGCANCCPDVEEECESEPEEFTCSCVAQCTGVHCDDSCAAKGICCPDKVEMCGGAGSLSECTCWNICNSTGLAACNACSCEVGCHEKGTCCPDYYGLCTQQPPPLPSRKQLTSAEKKQKRIAPNRPTVTRKKPSQTQSMGIWVWLLLGLAIFAVHKFGVFRRQGRPKVSK